ncbi:MAG: hypothetical protein CL907_03790 [Dehalococcoidia bacterium]|nr:hypothetical protein [Dehalococcoidia bacterium]MEC7921459.1 hypothetical protein [Chloroflexota bacterium]MEC9451274.1 hypothetical protein [Chloroflexota bacterium]
MDPKLIYNFWLSIKPFRSLWITPLIATGLIIIIFIYFGDSKDMKCDWESRDRWECSKPLENNK